MAVSQVSTPLIGVRPTCRPFRETKRSLLGRHADLAGRPSDREFEFIGLRRATVPAIIEDGAKLRRSFVCAEGYVAVREERIGVEFGGYLVVETAETTTQLVGRRSANGKHLQFGRFDGPVRRFDAGGVAGADPADQIEVQEIADDVTAVHGERTTPIVKSSSLVLAGETTAARGGEAAQRSDRREYGRPSDRRYLEKNYGVVDRGRATSKPAWAGRTPYRIR